MEHTERQTKEADKKDVNEDERCKERLTRGWKITQELNTKTCLKILNKESQTINLIKVRN